jgi:hypothetical protein
MLDWSEREHEDVDEAAINHQPSIDALRGCGSIQILGHTWHEGSGKILRVAGRKMERSRSMLLHWGATRLEIEPSDIYFLTGLPKRGEQLNLAGTRPGGQSLASLRLEWCLLDQNHAKGIEIKYISRRELMVISLSQLPNLWLIRFAHIATGSQNADGD